MKVWANTDKSKWGPGPWRDEPDKAQWVDEATGLDCLIVRGPAGALCGYVGVPPDHPMHGEGYWPDYEDDRPVAKAISSLDVHGGLTFADGCRESDDPSKGICHVPEPGRPADVWWFGFDCAHSQDYAPAFKARDRERREKALAEGDHETARIFADRPEWGEVYRSFRYVEAEVTRLARQIATATEETA